MLQILYTSAGGWAIHSKTVHGKWAAGWGTSKYKPTKAEVVAMQKDNGPRTAELVLNSHETSGRSGPSSLTQLFMQRGHLVVPSIPTSQAGASSTPGQGEARVPPAHQRP